MGLLGDRPVIVCLDSFKGTASAVAACAAVATGIHSIAPDIPVLQRPIADGGEGTIDALVLAGWQEHTVEVTGPTGLEVTASFATRDGTAVIELAQAAGLTLLPDHQPAPLTATTYGVGQLLVAALDSGCRQITLAVGGSATSDGGAVMLTALGARLFDADSQPLPPGGAALAGLRRVDLSGLDARLGQVQLAIASDVDNPLLGPSGAAAVYGPQKGADASQVVLLDAALTQFATVLSDELGTDPSRVPGAGAAGGTAFGALAALGAVVRSGAELLLDETGLRQDIPRARLVVVGEGRLDSQSLRGKAPVEIAAVSQRAGVPVVAIAGRIQLSSDELRTAGIGRGYALVDHAVDESAAMRETVPLLSEVGALLARELLAGRE
jgi:glycerate 2-kinase